MRNTNYSREIKSILTKQLRQHVSRKKLISKKKFLEQLNAQQTIDYCRNILRDIEIAQKFILPDVNTILTPKPFTNIVDKDLELPYKVIILEMPMSLDSADKCWMLVHDTGDNFNILVAVYELKPNKWILSPPIILDKKKPLTWHDGRVVVLTQCMKHAPEMSENVCCYFVDTLCRFLDMLAAPTVYIQDSPKDIVANNTKSSKKKNKNPQMPYDDYKYVFLDLPRVVKIPTNSSNRTLCEERFRPHEHTRAGHWRKYKSGKEVYIQPMEINQGVRKRVEKIYVVRPLKQVSNSSVSNL